MIFLILDQKISDFIEKSCETYLEYVGILGSKLVYLKVLLFPILFTADNCLLKEKWVLKRKIGTIHKIFILF